MKIEIVTKNKTKELVREEFAKLSEEQWKEFDRINNKLMLIEEDIKILNNGK